MSFFCGIWNLYTFSLLIGSLYFNLEFSLVNREVNSFNNCSPFSSAFKTLLTFVKFDCGVLRVPNTWQTGWNSDAYIFYIIFVFLHARTSNLNIIASLFLVTFTFRCSRRAAIYRFILIHRLLAPLFSVMPGKQSVSLGNSIYCCLYDLIYWY